MKKVKLRFYTEDDFNFLHEMLSDKETRKYFPFLYTTCKEQSLLRLRTRLMDQEFGYTNRFVIQDCKSKNAVGEISGRPAKDNTSIMELAVLVHPKFRAQGFAKAGAWELMKKMILKNPNLTRFRMEIADTNKASQFVAQRLDFDLVKDDKMQYWEKDVK